MDEAFSFEGVCRPPRFVARDGTRFPIALFSLFVYSKNGSCDSVEVSDVFASCKKLLNGF